MLPEMFNSLERDLRRKIQQGEAPFLGIFADDLGKYVRKFLHQRLAQHPSAVEAFVKAVQKFPAIFASYLIVHVMEGFGDAGHFDVYSYINNAIGKTLTQREKENLWHYFRLTCHFLGLPVSPRTSGTHFMVDEYLLQAGFPLQFIPDLVKRMVRLAKEVGLADDDDPESITLWQERLIDRLKAPFSIVAREAIERDSKGYYVRSFMRVLKEPDREGGVIERKLREALEKAPESGRISKRLSIPQVQLKDMQLGVLLPGGPEAFWEVDVDGEAAFFRPHDTDRFIPLDSSLPKQVNIKGVDSTLKQVLWGDEHNNRLIIFSGPSGRICRSSSLSEKELILDPGRYTVLSRFEPEVLGSDIQLVYAEPSIFFFETELMPGEKKPIRRGPAELLLQANSIPSLSWSGEPLKGIRGAELYPSRGLKLEAVFPTDLLEMRGAAYEIALRPGCLGNDETLPVEPDDYGKAVLDLEVLGKRWKPGVARILAELRRRGSLRAIARSSIVFWNGFDHLANSRFHCEILPVNLSEKLSENVVVRCEERQVSYRDDIHRFFRLIFEDGDRRHSLTWPVPGIFLSVAESGEDLKENAIKIGSILPVTSLSRSVLQIYCSRPAVLELGSFRTRVDFSKVGCKRLPLASLLEYAGAEGSTLTLMYQGEPEPIQLVRLVSPHTISSFSEPWHLNGHEIHLSLQSPAEAFNISIEEILTGQKSAVEFELETGESRTSGRFSTGGRVTVISSGEATYGIYCDLSGLGQGFWIFEITARIAGRWGALTDPEGNSYESHCLLSGLGQMGVFSDICLLAEELQLPAAEALLYGIHKRLLNRYPAECATLVNLLFRLWNKIFRKLRDISSVEYFFSLFGERPTGILTSSWIPRHNLGAIFPELFCYPAPKYSRVSKQSESLVADCLRQCRKFDDLFTVFCSGTVDVAALCGFANPTGIAAGELPMGFECTRYYDALRERDLPERWSALNDDNWQPGPGDYLGPMHYRYCISRMRATYNRTLGENLEKHGKAMMLLKKTQVFTFAGLAGHPVPGWASEPTDLGLFETERSCGCLLSESEQLQSEELQAIVKFLSLFGRACRFAARSPDTLKRFFYEIKEKMEFSEPAERERDLRGILSYLLYVGEDLFAFYLMLAELIFVTNEKVEEEKCLRAIP